MTWNVPALLCKLFEQASSCKCKHYVHEDVHTNHMMFEPVQERATESAPFNNFHLPDAVTLNINQSNWN